MDCEFCAIVAEEEPAHEVYRDGEVVAFLDRWPATRGHTLVVPTVHREGLPETSPDEAATLFRAVRTVAVALEDVTDADGVSVFQSSGAAAGQDVFHVHVHVLPRFADDDVHFAPSRTELGDPEGEALADAVRVAVED